MSRTSVATLLLALSWSCVPNPAWGQTSYFDPSITNAAWDLAGANWGAAPGGPFNAAWSNAGASPIAVFNPSGGAARAIRPQGIEVGEIVVNHAGP